MTIKEFKGKFQFMSNFYSSPFSIRRSDWNEVRLLIMEEGLKAKFDQNPNIRELLINTGEQELQEGNRWGDTYWGIDLRTGEGRNHLRKLLEKIRKELTFI